MLHKAIERRRGGPVHAADPATRTGALERAWGTALCGARVVLGTGRWADPGTARRCARCTELAADTEL